jgi:hypothetical protein
MIHEIIDTLRAEYGPTNVGELGTCIIDRYDDSQTDLVHTTPTSSTGVVVAVIFGVPYICAVIVYVPDRKCCYVCPRPPSRDGADDEMELIGVCTTDVQSTVLEARAMVDEFMCN